MARAGPAVWSRLPEGLRQEIIEEVILIYTEVLHAHRPGEPYGTFVIAVPLALGKFPGGDSVS